MPEEGLWGWGIVLVGFLFGSHVDLGKRHELMFACRSGYDDG